MRLAVLKERHANETRVAATPETVKRLIGLGLEVVIEAGAGQGSSIPDSDFEAAGAKLAPSAAAALAGAGVVFAVQTPRAEERASIPRGALLVCVSGAQANKDVVPSLATAGIDAAALELLPRITRAQSMDVLSSQANLAGYRSVIEGANAFDRGFAMMMTAAGTVQPARVFVVGAGVAGLQAIATARRLGAIVSATDVRPAAKEEIKSLGANFVGVEDDETAKQTGAYAREMTAEFRQKQAELMAATVAKNDLVICTALVQGGKAPVLVTKAMVDAMRPGSVVVDLASDGGGNCEATRPGELFITQKGVKVLGFLNWPSRLPVAASTLYAKNLLTFLTTFWDKDAKAPKLPPEDEIVKGVMLTRGGTVVHARFASAVVTEAVAPPSASPSPDVTGAVEPPASAPAAQAAVTDLTGAPENPRDDVNQAESGPIKSAKPSEPPASMKPDGASKAPKQGGSGKSSKAADPKGARTEKTTGESGPKPQSTTELSKPTPDETGKQS